MICPQCKREYRRQDFSREETYFECDDCSVALDGAPLATPVPSIVALDGDVEPADLASLAGGALPDQVIDLRGALATPLEIARGYDKSIIALRWLARLIDSIVLLLAYYGASSLNGRLGTQYNVAALAAVLAWLVYFILFESWAGRTPGKMFMGLRVVDSKGRVPGFRRALIRGLLSLLEVNPLIFGGLPAAVVVFLSPNRQRLGDIAADTFVLIEEDTKRMSRT